MIYPGHDLAHHVGQTGPLLFAGVSGSGPWSSAEAR